LTIRRSKSGKPRHLVLTREGAACLARLGAGSAGNEIMRRKARSGCTSHQIRHIADACEHSKIDPPTTFTSFAILGKLYPVHVTTRKSFGLMTKGKKFFPRLNESGYLR
jgi:hypothetical protein